MTNTISDIEKADVILVTGSNTTENHPVLSSYIKRAVTQKGAKLIVIDPRRIKLAEFAEYWMRQNLGSDVAWINGMMNVIISEDLYDKTFVAERTEGFEDMKKTELKDPSFSVSLKGLTSYELSLYDQRENKYVATSSQSDYPFLLAEWRVKKIKVDLKGLIEE